MDTEKIKANVARVVESLTDPIIIGVVIGMVVIPRFMP